MKTITYYLCALSLLILLSCNQSIPNRLKYIDEQKPSIEATLFAADFISTKTEGEFGSVFNQKGDEFFYGVDLDNRAEIRYTKLENKKWQTPQTIISHPSYSFNDPFLSPKEDRLYYISDMPRNEQDTIKDYDIWYSKKMGNKWSKPINAGAQINSNKNEYYISFTSDGAMYFASNKNTSPKRKRDFDIYKSNYIDGTFQTPEKVSDAINTRRYEADVFIAPDETYIIFCSIRKSGLGRGDLYVSFKDENNHWTTAINMGEIINSNNHELCPFVTRDGQYLFYTSNQDIYWISTDILKELKKKQE